MNPKIIELTDENADSILSDGSLTLIDFWAEWCSPCRMLSATIDLIADTYSDKIRIAKADIENGAMEVAKKFGVSALPTIVITKGYNVIKKKVGLSSKQEIIEAIENA